VNLLANHASLVGGLDFSRKNLPGRLKIDLVLTKHKNFKILVSILGREVFS